MQLFFMESSCSGIKVVTVESSSSIVVVKRKVAAKIRRPAHRFTLRFGEKHLEDTLTLADYDIKHEATIRVVFVLREFCYKDSLLPTRSLFSKSTLRPEGVSVSAPTKVYLQFRDQYVVSRLRMHLERVCLVELPPQFNDLPYELLRLQARSGGFARDVTLGEHIPCTEAWLAFTGTRGIELTSKEVSKHFGVLRVMLPVGLKPGVLYAIAIPRLGLLPQAGQTQNETPFVILDDLYLPFRTESYAEISCADCCDSSADCDL